MCQEEHPDDPTQDLMERIGAECIESFLIGSASIGFSEGCHGEDQEVHLWQRGFIGQIATTGFL